MRYALYLLPTPETALWKAASALLGYDSVAGREVATPTLVGIDREALRDATEDPRRYGFHMTLKAPFRLAEGQTEAALSSALAGFCAGQIGFELPTLTVEARRGTDGEGFVCLAPEAPCPALFLMEQAVVRVFEPFRAALDAREIARRRPERLTPRQRELLDIYGYPFVLDEFRPHFSLTGHVLEPEHWRAHLEAWLGREVPERHVTITGIGLFRQCTPSDRFQCISFEPFEALTYPVEPPCT
ncbi:MAG: DUF1045 domain-containing protein [Proteobacteria bacterium]|nr:DUF1045 domain-containing protein [Pseudomonadota bacterium]